MRRVLVAGAGSYIGHRLASFCIENDLPCEVVELDVVGDAWRGAELSGYDSVVLVAGIAHRKETAENAHLYYEVNRDLAYDIARAAKVAGVPHFVMLSTMSVYGMDEGVITPQTKPDPKTHYGKSKLEGEGLVRSLSDENFKVAVLRPPMVYGPGCKGNFNALVALAKRSPIFPLVNNERSAIYVDNLCAFILTCVAERSCGTFFPQDEEYMNTSEAVRVLAEACGRQVLLSRSLGVGTVAAMAATRKVRKAFGSLVYEGVEQHGYSYCVVQSKMGLKKSAKEITFKENKNTNQAVDISTDELNYQVRVLLSTYNGKKYLKEQVNSILGQRGSVSVSLLVRDDGSNDGTVNVLRQLELEHPDSISVIFGENVGVNRSFFELMKEAGNYDFYAFSDQDDVWLPDKLEIAVRSLIERGGDGPLLYASTSYVVDDKLRTVGQTRRMKRPITPQNAVIQNICPGHTQVFNREVLELCLEDLDESKIYVYDSWVSCTTALYGSIVFDNHPHALYRQHEKNSLGSGDSTLAQIATSCRRAVEKQGIVMHTQLRYFLEKNTEVLDRGESKTLLGLLEATGSIASRIRILSIPIYRQSRLETIFYKTAWIIGLI